MLKLCRLVCSLRHKCDLTVIVTIKSKIRYKLEKCVWRCGGDVTNQEFFKSVQ
jgi:hypothetical protein